MATGKTTTLPLRIEPGLKETLRTASDHPAATTTPHTAHA
jgi:hypothetical protein